MAHTFAILSLFILISCAWGKPFQTGPIPDEDWGYITINEDYDSNMFWWLYGAQQEVRTNFPLVVWLQGGPGASSLFGDFLEIGPLNQNLQPRNTTWLQSANLLFIDNPIGTGFSYTVNPKGFSTSDEEIADNLVILMQGFLDKYPIFETIPFWVFSESYGGKMTANFGVALHNAIQNGQLNLNFMGVALGDSWVAPVNCMYSYAPYLFSISEIDSEQADNLTYYAIQAEVAWNKGDGVQATNFWGIQQGIAEEFAAGVNIYNFKYFYDYIPEQGMNNLMNGPIKQKLGIIPNNVTWGGQSNDVFTYMQGDFMRPAIDKVDNLLTNGYQVVVYGGQLDIIVDIICIDSWIQQLNWLDLESFNTAARVVQNVNGVPNGFLKTYKNFSLWNILNAGHMVPYDNANMALQMFNAVVLGNKK